MDPGAERRRARAVCGRPVRAPAGRSRHVDLRFLEERGVPDYEPAFARVGREGIAGLIVAANVRNHEHRRRIIELAAHHRVPATVRSATGGRPRTSIGSSGAPGPVTSPSSSPPRSSWS
jgi:hypothetical protein